MFFFNPDKISEWTDLQLFCNTWQLVGFSVSYCLASRPCIQGFSGFNSNGIALGFQSTFRLFKRFLGSPFENSIFIARMKHFWHFYYSTNLLHLKVDTFVTNPAIVDDSKGWIVEMEIPLLGISVTVCLCKLYNYLVQKFGFITAKHISSYPSSTLNSLNH